MVILDCVPFRILTVYRNINFDGNSFLNALRFKALVTLANMAKCYKSVYSSYDTYFILPEKNGRNKLSVFKGRITHSRRYFALGYMNRRKFYLEKREKCVFTPWFLQINDKYF